MASAVTEREDALRREMAGLCGGGDAFFYAKLATSSVRQCVALWRAGFAIIDTAITLVRETGAKADAASSGIRICVAKGDQHEAILRIAEKCFRWSRFHLDPQIPVESANAVKRRWVESYIEGTRGSLLYAADID